MNKDTKKDTKKDKVKPVKQSKKQSKKETESDIVELNEEEDCDAKINNTEKPREQSLTKG